jgi:mannose/fructose/N-acetylgalactosamine-specific phosphotransferase system component IIC
MIKLLPKKEIPFLQFGPAGNQSFLWAYLTAIFMTLCFLQFIPQSAKQIVRFSMYMCIYIYSNVIHHFKGFFFFFFLTTVPLSLATFIPNTFLHGFQVCHTLVPVLGHGVLGFNRSSPHMVYSLSFILSTESTLPVIGRSRPQISTY